MRFPDVDLAREKAGQLVVHLNQHPATTLEDAARAVGMDASPNSIVNNTYRAEFPDGWYVISRDPWTGQWSGEKYYTK